MIKVNAQSVCNRLGVVTFADTRLAKSLQYVPALSPKGPWIAGGAVRKTLQCVELDSDWDFFFADSDQAEKFEKDLVQLGARKVSSNDKNITYIFHPLTTEPVEPMKIQIIKFQYYENAEQVIDSFDFTLAQFAFDGTDLYMSDFALWDVARKRLVPHRITYGAASVRRLLKYANQGFTVCAGAITEMLKQVADDPGIIHGETLYID